MIDSRSPTRPPPTALTAAGAAACEDWPPPRGRRAAFRAAGRADLAAVRAHVADACAAASAPDELCEALVLAVDEVCANVVGHAYADAPGPLSVDVALLPPAAGSGPAAGGVVRVTVVDAGPPFDPRALAPPDPIAESTLDARAPGGFGWFLVRRSVDAVDYERLGAHNVVTLDRRLGPPPSAAPPAGHRSPASQPRACRSPSPTSAT